MALHGQKSHGIAAENSCFRKGPGMDGFTWARSWGGCRWIAGVLLSGAKGDVRAHTCRCEHQVAVLARGQRVPGVPTQPQGAGMQENVLLVKQPGFPGKSLSPFL